MNQLRIMYTNNRNVGSNELIVVYYGNSVTIRGDQTIINGRLESQLPHKINDFLVRKATTIMTSVEGENSYFMQMKTVYIGALFD